MDRRQKAKKTRPSSKTSNTTQARAPNNDTVEESEQKKQQEFERELAWCIEQLEMGLTSAKKPSAKQAQDAVKILKILKNPTTPLVKKRQAMRNTFGDYRTKMKEEEKRYLSSAQKISLKAGSEENKQKFTFLKKSSSHLSENKTESDLKQTPLAFNGTPSNFTFNFEDDNAGKEAENEISTEDQMKSLSLESEEGKTVPLVTESESEQAGSMFFKMTTSDNDFRFNFDGNENLSS